MGFKPGDVHAHVKSLTGSHFKERPCFRPPGKLGKKKFKASRLVEYGYPRCGDVWFHPVWSDNLHIPKVI